MRYYRYLPEISDDNEKVIDKYCSG